MGVSYIDFKDVQINDVDVLVVGCGFAGAVVAREYAERANKKVLIIDKRSHIAGNMYDEYDKSGILIHAYGPHIFHTNNKRAFEYIRRFTEWRDYQHEVLSNWYGTFIPVPFNKNTADIVFGEEKAKVLVDKLISTFGDERKVTINELKKQEDPDLANLAQWVYENIFLYYTQKQWGLTPEEVDPSVTGRVPVNISRDNRYFQDTYQGMPADGYTVLFENMLTHENISVCLNTEAESVFDLVFESSKEDSPLKEIRIKEVAFDKPIIFTGCLDELFLSRFGRLPYRSLEFEYEQKNVEYDQPCGTVNYTVTEDYTRITEFKWLTGQKSDHTTIMKEYSKPYEDPRSQTPYYAIINDENNMHYQKYLTLTKSLPNFHVLGRLAEYKYYNMDAIIARALELSDELIGE